MPYHTSVSVPGFDVLHAFDGFFHGKKLLIACQFLDAGIEDSEVEDEFQQALGATEVVEVFVLQGGGAHFLVTFVDQFQQPLVIRHLCLFVDEHLMPFAPELGGRSRGGIAAEAVADGQKQGTVDIEATDAVVFLVAQVL